MTQRVQFKVNGTDHQLDIPARRLLVDCLRFDLGLTGTKEGCNDGNCGACTVEMDGRIVTSCLVLGVEAEGKEITTIEGIADGSTLHPIQQSFLENAALQCGICTPGMIMMALKLGRKPTLKDIKTGLAGNLCRCTGYDKIVRAVLDTAQDLRETA